jgi:hypothetical protein
MSKPFTNDYREQCSLIDPEKPIQCYRNLNAKHNGKKGFFSVKQGSIVLFHTEVLFLKNVTFQVNERLRLKVVATKTKNVHAFVKGQICERPTFFTVDLDSQWIYYNPYKCSTFVTGNSPIYQACICALVKHGDTMKMAVDMISARYAKMNHKGLDTHEVCDRMYERVETCLL